jgi:hypothetical protein
MTAARMRTRVRWLFRDADGFVRFGYFPAALCLVVAIAALLVLGRASEDCQATGGHVAAQGKVLYCEQD